MHSAVNRMEPEGREARRKGCVEDRIEEEETRHATLDQRFGLLHQDRSDKGQRSRIVCAGMNRVACHPGRGRHKENEVDPVSGKSDSVKSSGDDYRAYRLSIPLIIPRPLSLVRFLSTKRRSA